MPLRRLAFALVSAALLAACGDSKPYEFDMPANFRSVDPKEFGQPIPGANSDPEVTRLLMSTELDEGFDFIRVYTTEDKQRLPNVKDVIRQLTPVIQQLNTKVIAERDTTLGGLQAVRLELEPADVLGHPLETWLTLAVEDKTAYFVQCQWERLARNRQVIQAGCLRVLQTFKRG